MAEELGPLPWMPLFWMEWLSLRLTQEQKAALLDLRCMAWSADPPCTLPNDDGRLATLSGLRERWDDSRAVLMEFFTPIENGRLLDKALYVTYLKQTAKRRAGGTGGRTRFAKQTSSTTQANAKQTPSTLSNILSLSLKREIETDVRGTQANAKQTSSTTQAEPHQWSSDEHPGAFPDFGEEIA